MNYTFFFIRTEFIRTSTLPRLSRKNMVLIKKSVYGEMERIFCLTECTSLIAALYAAFYSFVLKKYFSYPYQITINLFINK